MRCESFRLSWNPPDRLDHAGRLRRTWTRKVRPRLQKRSAPQRVTVFCSAPRPLRDKLAAEIAESMDNGVRVQVLPVHKAGLAWLLEDEIPQLAAHDVARVDLRFAAFRPTDPAAHWLDLPHRWLQEIYPADELLAQRLDLELHQIHFDMVDPDPADPRRVYQIIAYNAAGDIVHRAALSLLWDEHPYLVGMDDAGLVHPSAGGIVVDWGDGRRYVWPVRTDEALFWDFYQQSVLPSLRSHVLAVSRGRPTPDWEPYFESLQVDGFFGWPDEPLGVHQEFVSVGEALHEDIYFNSLDYVAALGEQFCGQPITAAGQVMPLIHDFYDAKGEQVLQSSPRAVVTLRAWSMPRYLPPLDLVVGHRNDMPKPERIRLASLTLNAHGDAVESVTVRAEYANAASARLAARVLARRAALAPIHFASNVAVTVQFAAGAAEECVDLGVSEVGPLPRPPEPAHDPTSDVIAPRQLEAILPDVSRLPGVSVWQLGRTYQGRPGYAIDVTLPLHSGQTHRSRHKLAQQKPTAMLIARHHANEVSSTNAVLALVRDLVDDPTQRDILARVNLVVLPLANPDGAAFHYQLMTEHPRWKHHAARFNAAGKEFSQDTFNPDTLFGEATFRRTAWSAWLPDAIVDNHGVPSHEWCQPFAGYNSPPRFAVSYHMVQAMLYGIITFAADDEQPAAALRDAVSAAVAQIPWLHERNQYWLNRYHTYGHRWSPDFSPLQTHNDMLFFFRGLDRSAQPLRRGFAGRYPAITRFEWVTEVPDETAQAAFLAECAVAHHAADVAMLRLLAGSAQPVQRQIVTRADGRITIRFHRERKIDG
ncbi:MAG: M14 family metallopeptidase [Caldilineaceae bacterium]